MQKSLCALLIVLAAALPVHAQEKADIPDPECDGGTFDMVKCLSDAAAKWDKRLNEAYRETLQGGAEGAAGAAAQSPAALGPVPRRQLRLLRAERRLDRARPGRDLPSGHDQGAGEGTRGAPGN